MNNKKMKIGIVFVISFMIVGYAAVNTTLDLNGNTIVGVNDDLNVFFDGLLINGLDKAELISKAKDSITFKVSDLDLSTNSKLDYLVTNKSTQYDANVTVSCTPNDNDYLRLENTSGAIKVDAMSSNSGSITAFSKNVDSIKKEGTLLYDIVKDQSLGLDTAVGLNYDAISSNTNGKGVYETINTDSGKSVYFYRGEISNNNVIFANTCWQLLRTTETNGVKLFYNGPSSNGKCTKPSGSGLGSIYYASAVTDNAYVGYMYGTVGSTTYESTHKNINNSLLKEKIDTWYKDILLGTHYEEALEDTVWCNDRSVVTDMSNSSQSYIGNGIGKSTTAYGFAIRGGHYTRVTKPTLKCTQENDRFTVDSANGNGALTYPVATITGDELIYAGATGGKPVSAGTSPPNTTYFLYYGSGRAWTMTPYVFQNTPIARGVVLYDGAISSMWTSLSTRDFGVRPAVSVDNSTVVLMGDGSFDSPYILGTEYVGEFTCKMQVDAIERNEPANPDVASANLYEHIKLTSLGRDTENSIDYNDISSSTNGEGIYETIDTNNGRPVYFYRGNVVNNNALFVNKCWKVVRTTETGGIKLIYNGLPSSDGTCENTGASATLGESIWNEEITDNAYVGYMTGTAGASSYKEAHSNSSNSTIKNFIDTWYENNILNTEYESMIDDTAIYCNDRTMVSDFSNFVYQDWLGDHSQFTTKGFGTNSTIYAGSDREGIAVGTTKPTLVCHQENDKLTKNPETGTGTLTYPIGLLTADEAVYAGSTGGVQGKPAINTEFYLHIGEKNFWTMTPHRYHNNNSIILNVGLEGNITNEGAKSTAYIRPVITLKGSTTILEGNGKAKTPFVLSKSNSKVPASWRDGGIFSSYYEQAYDTLETMTLEEKIGQLFIVRYYSNTTLQDAVANYHISGTTFYATDFTGKTEGQVKSMTSTLQENSKIPLITAVDEEGGTVVRVSSNTNLAKEPFKSSQELFASGGLPLISKDTVNKSALLRNLGLNMNFAPVVDIASPTAYIYKRTLGQSPEITGQYAETVIEASKNTGVSYSLKHFPGYGNNADTHTSSSVDETSLEELWNIHLVPFISGIDAGAETVMISHNIVSALDKDNPASLSKPVHDLLFDDLKFTGIAITDDLDMAGASDVPNRYTKALLAGNNIMLISNYADAQTDIKNSIENGTISKDKIDYLAFKVLAWKYYKGLL